MGNKWFIDIYEFLLHSLSKRGCLSTFIRRMCINLDVSYSLNVAIRLALFFTPHILLMVIGVYDQVACAQGLVGAPVDPRYGQSNEVGQLGDYGYDLARDCSRVATALSTIPSVYAGTKIAFGHNDGALGNPVRYVFTGMSVTLGGPTIVHLLGTFAINNFGGLGGGL